MSRSRTLLLAACAAALAGCDLAPHYHVPLTQVPVSFKEASYWRTAQPMDTLQRGAWWELYGDPILDQLEARVDNANPTLAAALAAYGRARAFAAEAQAGLTPTVSVGGEINTDRQSNRRPRRGKGEPNQYLYNSVNVQANYEIDFWDQIANEIRSGRDLAQATAADLENTRLLLHADLANDYVELRGFDAEIRVLQSAEQAFQQAVTLTENRLQGKISPLIDVTRAQTQYNDAAAQLTDVIASRALIEHAIAVLVGVPPADLTLAPERWDIKLPNVSPGLPSTLLERRPDIAAAERQVAAANAQIGVTRAAFYPTISLNLVYGLMAPSFNIFSLPDDFWAVGPGLALPLFEGGLRTAEEAAAIGAYKIAVANYRETVLGAFQEVEDNLALIRLLGQEQQQEDAAVTAAQQTLNMATSLYKDGATNFLDVVVAQTAALQAEQTATALRTRHLQASVGLVRALGGGWTRQDLPDRKDIEQTLDNQLQVGSPSSKKAAF